MDSVIHFDQIKNQIRLTEKEFLAIRDQSKNFMNGKFFELYLFGSRTNINKKGGDIDLLIVVQDQDYSWIMSEKIFLIAEIKSVIGDQKIDLTCATAQKMSSDPFLLSIDNKILLVKQ